MHARNRVLTSMAVSIAGTVSSVVVERAHGHHIGKVLHSLASPRAQNLLWSVVVSAGT